MDKYTTSKFGAIKKGDFFAFSTGEYSDYDCGRFSKALKPFNMLDMGKKWEDTFKPYGDDPDDIRNKWKSYDVECPEFVAWLTSEGFIELLDYKEFHLGSYGRFELGEY